jgi:nicotinamidase/pyrazinamidase
MKNHLLIVDPQNSFCDPKGELYVSNAEHDMSRLAEFIKENGDFLDRITVTLDSHNRMNIAHPVWWLDREGKHPEPFTVISAEDLREGRYTTVRPEDYNWSLSYLEKTVPHVVWPLHCLTGTWGHEVFGPLNQALQNWAETHVNLDFTFKGTSRYTEHFSVIRPSVEVPDDPATRTNLMLIKTLNQADRVFVAGEASSHCVADTVRDLVEAEPALVSKIVLMTDTMSPVTGFEDRAKDFFESMASQGLTLSDTASVSSDLKQNV